MKNNMKNILYKTKCYLIGNLQCINFSNAREWRKRFSNNVKSMGIITMSPLDKVFKNFKQENKIFKDNMFDLLEKGEFLKVHQEMQRIRRRDLAMIDHSTFIVGVLDVDNPTYGTIEELSFCQRQNKPVFLVIKQGIKKTPLWLLGMFKPDSFYNSLNDVILKLKNINNGMEEVSNEKWRIFEEKYNTITIK